ncbi:hypothetical protein RE6C_04085 [Rhodopirellula europaea 6C]|uniref:Uncharacterized protein n=1 Tax=Rhodopirellula europaea 6C TaxID=1263867 RepID=M2AYY1_9BACT|nr:hypothetical protein RE6C_04085 [Rhodopirellula europaea 6C]
MSSKRPDTSNANKTKPTIHFDRGSSDYVSHLILFHLNLHQLETLLPQLREAPLLCYSAFQDSRRSTTPRSN